MLPEDIQKIYETIKQEIIEGQYESGQALTEIPLAEKYGIKRTRIRQILRNLETDGLVEKIAGKGNFVKSITPEYLQGLFEMREALEAMACRLAARRRRDEDLEQLIKTFDNFEKNTDGNDLERKAELGEILHQFIRQSCRNPLIINSLELIKIQTTRIWRGGLSISGRFSKAFEGHKEILKAIKDRDEDLAEKIMKRHIAEAFRDYLDEILSQ